MREHPLFYRLDGGLDLAQFVCLLVTCFGLVAFGLHGAGIWQPSIAAWSFLGAFTVSCFIVWAARDRAELLAQARSPGEVARGIAAAQPDLFRDDERGAHPARERVAP